MLLGRSSSVSKAVNRAFRAAKYSSQQKTGASHEVNMGNNTAPKAPSRPSNYAVIHLPPAVTLNPDGNELLTDSIDEYYSILAEVERYTALNAPLDEIVEHERQHGTAAHVLGQTVIYSLLLKQSAKGRIMPEYSTQLLQGARELTRLGFASVAAHPYCPEGSSANRDDIDAIKKMGYAGVDDVYRQVTIHNTLYPAILYPVPLSPSTGALLTSYDPPNRLMVTLTPVG